MWSLFYQEIPLQLDLFFKGDLKKPKKNFINPL